jgi:hypothetical protein
VVLAGALAAWFLIGGSGPPEQISTRMSYSLVDLRRRFDGLSHQGTNQCGLSFAAVRRLQPGKDLQGSCCSAMDLEHYVAQVRGLRRYVAVPEIPTDPYDIPVSLAKRLLGFDTDIRLSAATRHEYRDAARLSHEHGPCCCPCWRWDTFRGLAKFLLTRLHYDGRQVAQVWDLEDGCGGALSSSS